MPTTTATQNLTVPVSTDFIEDQWSYHAAMAGQLEQRFNSHDDDAARVSPPPLAVLDCTISRNYPTPATDNNQYDTMIMFDTVVVDTAGMADLDVNPWALTPPTVGMYHFNCYVKVLPSGCTGPGTVTLSLSSRGATGVIFDVTGKTQSLEVALTGSTSVCVAGDLWVTSLGKSYGFPIIGFLGSSCAATFTPVYARFAMYKVRDL